MTHPVESPYSHYDHYIHIDGPPTPETVYKVLVPYLDYDPCPICGQSITIDHNLDGSEDWRCILCGWRREKTPVPMPVMRPGWKEKPQAQRIKIICPMCGRTFSTMPSKKDLPCRACRQKIRRANKKGKPVAKSYYLIPEAIKTLIGSRSMYKLEPEIGIFAGALGKWCRHDRSINLGELEKLAAFFGVTKEEIAVERTGKADTTAHDQRGLAQRAG